MSASYDQITGLPTFYSYTPKSHVTCGVAKAVELEGKVAVEPKIEETLNPLAKIIMEKLTKDELIADILKHFEHPRHMKKSDYDKIISDRLSRGARRGTNTQFRLAIHSLKNNSSNNWMGKCQTRFGDIIHEINDDTIVLSPTWRTAMDDYLRKTTRKISEV